MISKSNLKGGKSKPRAKKAGKSKSKPKPKVVGGMLDEIQAGIQETERQKNSIPEFSEEAYTEELARLKKEKATLIKKKRKFMESKKLTDQDLLFGDADEDDDIKRLQYAQHNINKLDQQISDLTKKYLPYIEHDLKGVQVGVMPKLDQPSKGRKLKELKDLDVLLETDAQEEDKAEKVREINEMVEEWKAQNEGNMPRAIKEKVEQFLDFAMETYGLDLEDRKDWIEVALKSKTKKTKSKTKKTKTKMAKVEEERVVRKFVEPKDPKEEYEERMKELLGPQVLENIKRKEEEDKDKKKKLRKKLKIGGDDDVDMGEDDKLVFKGFESPKKKASGKKAKKINAKAGSVLDAPVPSNKQQLRKFLVNAKSLLGKDQIHAIAKPLIILLKKDEFRMEPTHYKAFEKVKTEVSQMDLPEPPPRKKVKARKAKPVFHPITKLDRPELQAMEEVGGWEPPQYLRTYVRSLFHSQLFSLLERKTPESVVSASRASGKEIQAIRTLKQVIDEDFHNWALDVIKREEFLGNKEARDMVEFQAAELFNNRKDPKFFVYELSLKLGLPFPFPQGSKFDSRDLSASLRNALKREPSWLLGGFLLNELDSRAKTFDGSDLVVFIAQSLNKFQNYYMGDQDSEYKRAYDDILTKFAKDRHLEYMNTVEGYNTLLSDKYQREMVNVRGVEMPRVQFITEEYHRRHPLSGGKTQERRGKDESITFFSFPSEIVDRLYDEVPNLETLGQTRYGIDMSRLVENLDFIENEVVPYVHDISFLPFDQQHLLFENHFKIKISGNEYSRVLDVVLRLDVRSLEREIFDSKKTVRSYMFKISELALFLSNNGAGKYCEYFHAQLKAGHVNPSNLGSAPRSELFPELVLNASVMKNKSKKASATSGLKADIMVTQNNLMQVFYSLDSSTLHLRSRVQTEYSPFDWKKYVLPVLQRCKDRGTNKDYRGNEIKLSDVVLYKNDKGKIVCKSIHDIVQDIREGKSAPDGEDYPDVFEKYREVIDELSSLYGDEIGDEVGVEKPTDVDDDADVVVRPVDTIFDLEAIGILRIDVVAVESEEGPVKFFPFTKKGKRHLEGNPRLERLDFEADRYVMKNPESQVRKKDVKGLNYRFGNLDDLREHGILRENVAVVGEEEDQNYE